MISKENLFKALDLRFKIVGALIGAHILASSWLTSHWILDLTNHTRPLEVVLLAISVIWLALRNSKKLGFVVVLLLAVSSFYYQFLNDVQSKNPFSIVANPPFKIMKDQNIQVISYNVLTSNKNHAEVVSWLRSTIKPGSTNIVFLIETNKSWIDSLSVLKKDLPYSIEIPRDDNFGLMLLSNEPLSDVKEVTFEKDGIPALTGMIKGVRIYGLHPLPPIDTYNFNSRNEYYQNVRKSINTQKMPTLVFGDLNSSPWSENILMLLESKISVELSLLDTANGLFRPFTWSAIDYILSAPVDYILFTPHFVPKLFKKGPSMGSDHYPLVAEF